jgi:hypothetical protein
MEITAGDQVLDLEAFTTDLFSSGSKEMKEVIQLITRLMNLVIGALDQVEQQMNRIDGRIRSIESRPVAPMSTPTPAPGGMPGHSGGAPAGPSGPGGVAEELRSAVAARGTPGGPPGAGIPGAGMPAAPAEASPAGGGWQPGFQGLTTPTPAAEPAGGPGPVGGGMGIRAALQNELKDAFKKLKSSMDAEE